MLVIKKVTLIQVSGIIGLKSYASSCCILVPAKLFHRFSLFIIQWSQSGEWWCDSILIIIRSFLISSHDQKAQDPGFQQYFHEFFQLQAFSCEVFIQSIPSWKILQIIWKSRPLTKHCLHRPAEALQKFLLHCVQNMVAQLCLKLASLIFRTYWGKKLIYLGENYVTLCSSTLHNIISRARKFRHYKSSK